MNILMLTNTYLPHVGGVARSVDAFAREYRRWGHRVLIVAPQFEGTPQHEEDVIRIPAIQRFNGSDFSVRLPIPGLLNAALADFRPDVIHSHHPFLLGDTAVRVAARYGRPLVFTHHTMYEHYTHYVPVDWPRMARFVKRLATGYANLCDLVFAPSESVAAILRQRGVLVPIEVVPTGVQIERFAHGDGQRVRQEVGIPQGALVIGHVGRLAPEKNLGFLAAAVARVLRRLPHAHFVVVGSGPSEADIRRRFADADLARRLHLLGPRTGQALVDAYHAMDVFVFASLSETQGMVLTEAMAAGVPVVALDAPGAREVVVDGRNGRLLAKPSVRRFAAAVADLLEASPAERQALSSEARATAERFSMPRCAEKALAHYADLLAKTPREKSFEDSPWEATLRWLEREWELWSNLVRSARGAWKPRRRWRGGWGRWLGPAGRALKRWTSRSEWGIRLMGLPVAEPAAAEPGLILIQIDGLSHTQFQRALARGKLPTLRRLVRREGYQAWPFYSGLPSSTPAVQGELFYGVKAAVPAFSFRDPQSGRLVRMYEAEVAERIERDLRAQGAALLEGGSVYSNVYTGGAAEVHFCAPVLRWGQLLRALNPLALAVLVVWHLASVLRVAGLMALEVVLAVLDFLRGCLAGRSVRKELKFIPARVVVSIVLRELATIGAVLDATRGLPIIHLNLLGYDEQAHRRGPSSRFAHWTLKGIDGCIRRIWHAAGRSKRRQYQMWIYSDHGQESTLAYPLHTGRTIQEVVADLIPGAEVAAMGPLAHIYPPEPLSDEHKAHLARRFVRDHAIPAGYYVRSDGTVWAVTARGHFAIPEQAAEVLGEDHPFLSEVAEDLRALCRHRYSGELILSGWARHCRPLSFPDESGAHAGPGAEETLGFVLLPPGTCVPEKAEKWLRPLDLRAAVLHALGRLPLRTGRRVVRPRPDPHAVRVMSYNVHGCVGSDGRLAPERIAQLIAQYDPDIVALQELQTPSPPGQPNLPPRPETTAASGLALPQRLQEIVEHLQRDFLFGSALYWATDGFDSAVVARRPLRVLGAGRLLPAADGDDQGLRGALWVEVEMEGQTVQILNLHLGHDARQRLAHIEELLGPEWLGGPRQRGPLVICGDLNSSPRGRAYRRLARRFRDVQLGLPRHRARRTYSSRYPWIRIDHVFVSRHWQVVAAEVPRAELAVRASDHRPVVVDLRLAAAVPIEACPAGVAAKTDEVG